MSFASQRNEYLFVIANSTIYARKPRTIMYDMDMLPVANENGHIKVTLYEFYGKHADSEMSLMLVAVITFYKVYIFARWDVIKSCKRFDGGVILEMRSCSDLKMIVRKGFFLCIM